MSEGKGMPRTTVVTGGNSGVGFLRPQLGGRLGCAGSLDGRSQHQKESERRWPGRRLGDSVPEPLSPH